MTGSFTSVRSHTISYIFMQQTYNSSFLDLKFCLYKGDTLNLVLQDLHCLHSSDTPTALLYLLLSTFVKQRSTKSKMNSGFLSTGMFSALPLGILSGSS